MAKNETHEALSSRAKAMWQTPEGRAAFLGGKASKRILREAALVGQTFARVTITAATKRDASGNVLCDYTCRCGNTGTARIADLKAGKVQSCGCALVDANRAALAQRRAKRFSADSAQHPATLDFVPGIFV